MNLVKRVPAPTGLLALFVACSNPALAAPSATEVDQVEGSARADGPLLALAFDDKQHLYDVIADVTRSPDGNAFLQEVAEATRQPAEPVGVSLL